MKPRLGTRISAALRCLRGDMSGIRHVLPHRRESETRKFLFSDHTWFATVSRFEDGQIAELFVSTAKSGELLRAMANDAATAASIALQYGAPPELLRNAFTRNDRGAPASPICAIFDELIGDHEGGIHASATGSQEAHSR